MNGIASSSRSGSAASLALAQLFFSGHITAIWAGFVLGHVLASIDEVEPRHLAHNQENRVDRLTDRLGNHPGKPAGELPELGFSAASPDVALDDGHGSLLPAPTSFWGSGSSVRTALT